MSEDATGRRPSIRDVARLADVSYQTVSRVLNDHPSVRPETRQRILEVMEQLQYRPNLAARALGHEPLPDDRHPRRRQLDVRTRVEHRGDRGGRPRTRLLGEHGEHRPRRSAVDPRGLAHLIAQSIEGLVVIAPQVRVFRALAAQRLDIPTSPCSRPIWTPTTPCRWTRWRVLGWRQNT